MKDRLPFFGLRDEPFRLTPDIEYFYPSESHKETLELLNYFLKDGDGFFMLIGYPGTGKTTLIRKFLEGLDENFEVALIVTPMLKPIELIKTILNDLGIEPRNSDLSENLRIFQDYLIKLAQDNKKLLLIIDEAQSLPIESLEQIRLLSNIELQDSKPLYIVLSGQPELEKMVKNQIRQLNQRITIRCTLKAFNKQETDEYVNFRAAKAGGSIKMTRYAQSLLHRVSKGIPRNINSIMKRAMIISYSKENKAILYSDIKQAAHSLDIEHKNGLKSLIVVIFFVIILVMFFVYVG